MNAYLDILESDINRLQDLSAICRGEWCRFLESEADALQNEIAEFRICEGDFESARIAEMSIRIRDAYQHLTEYSCLTSRLRFNR